MHLLPLKFGPGLVNPPSNRIEKVSKMTYLLKKHTKNVKFQGLLGVNSHDIDRKRRGIDRAMIEVEETSMEPRENLEMSSGGGQKQKNRENTGSCRKKKTLFLVTRQ